LFVAIESLDKLTRSGPDRSELALTPDSTSFLLVAAQLAYQVNTGDLIHGSANLGLDSSYLMLWVAQFVYQESGEQCLDKTK